MSLAEASRDVRQPGQPLTGVRVLDFTWGGAGPFATKVLADHGAEVIKVETGTRLDFPRTTGPYQGKKKGINRSGYFSNRNSSKLGVTLNFKTREALAVALKLAAQCDVVVNNFRAGVIEKLGLGYAEISRLRPDVIYVSMPLQGTSGPQAHYSGIGHTLNALAGIYAVTGYEDGTVVGPGTNFPDHSVNPGHAAVAILAALRHRRRTGEGQYIEVSQLESSATLLGPYIADYSLNGRVPQPVGNSDPDAAPYGMFPCRDGLWCAISVRDERQWQGFCATVLSGWTDDAAFASAEGRRQARGRLEAIVTEWTTPQDAHDLAERLQANGVPAAAVQSSKDLVTRDPQTAARESFQALDHPEMGMSLYNRAPFRFSRTWNGLRSPAPLLGQHNDYVFREIAGLTDAEIEALDEKDVFK